MSFLCDIAVDYGGYDDSVTDINSVVQKLLFAFGTPIGARKWKPKYGCKVISRLFEPFDDTTAGWIGVDLSDAVKNEANEVEQYVKNFKISVVTSDHNTYKCTMSFNIVLPTVDNNQPVSFSFSLSRLNAAIGSTL